MAQKLKFIIAVKVDLESLLEAFFLIFNPLLQIYLVSHFCNNRNYSAMVMKKIGRVLTQTLKCKAI